MFQHGTLLDVLELLWPVIGLLPKRNVLQQTSTPQPFDALLVVKEVAVMQFSGEEVFTVPPQELWDKLTDASFLAKHLPGVREVEEAEPKRAVCRVRPGFSFLSAPLKMTVEILDEPNPLAASMRVRGEGIGASLTIETALQLHAENGGTKLVWQGEVTQLGGLLKAISKGLLEGAARKVIADGWSNIRKEVDAE